MLRTCKIAVSEEMSAKGNCNGITPKSLAKSVASNFWSALYGHLGTTTHSVTDVSGLKKFKFYTQVRKQDTIHILSTLSDASTMLQGGKAFE